MLSGAAIDPATLFAPYAGARAILVAVSGGPDSMALLWLAAAWARGAGRPRIEAATVDHMLRPEGREEALLVARQAERLGVRHHILEWTGAKPVTRLQERARAARYRLLDACAAQIGADVLLTAHHADDQAETILFRLQRGSGVAGLAGMRRSVRRGAIVHGRPLLDLAKDDLVGVCERAEISFATDVSNADPRFARTRLRRLTGLLAEAGFRREHWLRLGARAARIDDAMEIFMQRTLEGLGAEAGAGSFRAALGGEALPDEFLVRLLAAQTARLGGGQRGARLDRAEALAGRLAAALRARAPVRATVGGALVQLDAAGVLTLRRESARKSRKTASDVHAKSNYSPGERETKAGSLGKVGHEA